MIGALFVHYNIMISVNRAPGTPWRKRVHIVLEVAAIAFFTAVTSYPILYTKVISNATISALFQNCKYVATSGLNAIEPESLLGLCNQPGTAAVKGFTADQWTPVMSYELIQLLLIAAFL